MVEKSVDTYRRRKRSRKKEKRSFPLFQFLFPIFTAMIITLSILGPEIISRYKDQGILHVIHIQTAEAAAQGYRYALSSQEKLYIFSEALKSQNQQTEGTYAFIVNHKEPYEKEITGEEIYDICNQELARLQELKILPEMVKEVENSVYDGVLYSAIDVLEPRNNVAVWKLSLSNIQSNMNKDNRIIDAYLDADNGKIYEFYARTEYEWEDIDPDAMIEKWIQYMGIEVAVAYDAGNPLMETTPYFKNYIISGGGEERTVVTIGFYEGINELFLKVSR